MRIEPLRQRALPQVALLGQPRHDQQQARPRVALELLGAPVCRRLRLQHGIVSSRHLQRLPGGDCSARSAARLPRGRRAARAKPARRARARQIRPAAGALTAQIRGAVAPGSGPDAPQLRQRRLNCGSGLQQHRGFRRGGPRSGQAVVLEQTVARRTGSISASGNSTCRPRAGLMHGLAPEQPFLGRRQPPSPATHRARVPRRAHARSRRPRPGLRACPRRARQRRAWRRCRPAAAPRRADARHDERAAAPQMRMILRSKFKQFRMISRFI